MAQSSEPVSGAKPARPKAFSCPQCGGTITLRAVGHTVTVACQNCGSLVDANDERHQLIEKAAQEIVTPYIPLGSRGQIGDGLYEVIGYLQKREGAYGWEEYLLFNPYIGFRWLVQIDGHWNFVRTIFDKVAASHKDNTIEYQGRTFRCFNRGNTEVSYVLGEFYWRVRVGDRALGVDFVDAPYMLSAEASEGEISWSLGEYVPRSVVAGAFGVDLPLASGIGANQPSGVERWMSSINKIGAIAAFALLIVQIAIATFAHNEIVLRTTIPSSWVKANKPVSLGPIHLSDGYDSIYARTTAPVSNNWVEVEYSLVNKQNNESYEFLQSIEYYFGTDSDGRWSEGSQDADGFLSTVPGGDYDLIAEIATGDKAMANPIGVTLERGRVSWQTFLIALGLIGFLPLCLCARHFLFENSRWSNSDYTMFGSVREDDDD